MTFGRHTLLPVLAISTMVGLAACSDSPSAAQAQATPASPGTVVAEVGGRKITLDEVDKKWEEFDAAERNRVTQLLYQNRRNMLDQILGEVLIEQAAKKAGMAPDTYAAQEAAKLVQPVTEADIVEFYNQNKDRANGRTLEQLRAPVKEFLEGQRKQQAKAQLVDNLREKDASIRVMLDPPRYTVELANHDPVLGDPTAAITLVEFSDYQ